MKLAFLIKAVQLLSQPPLIFVTSIASGSSSLVSVGPAGRAMAQAMDAGLLDVFSHQVIQ